MRPLYRVNLRLGNAERGIPTQEQINAVISEWIAESSDDVLTQEHFNSDNRVNVQDFTLERVLVDGKEGNYQGVSYSHIQENERWQTEVNSLVRPNENPIVSIQVAHGNTNRRMAPPRHNLLRPRIVPTLLKEFSTPGGLSDAPYCCPQEEGIRKISEKIKDPARHLPVVFVSLLDQNHRALVSPISIANQLAGLAYVAVPGRADECLLLDKYLGAGAGVYDGAVKIYWPVEAGRDVVPSTHFPASQTRDEREFTRNLLRMLSQFSTESPLALSFVDVKNKKMRMDFLARNSNLAVNLGDAEQLAQEYSVEASVNANRAEQLGQELAKANRTIEGLQAQLNQKEEARSSGVQYLPDFKNLAEAYELAKERIEEKRLICHPRVDKMVARSTYNTPVHLYNALVWLSSEYLDAKRKVKEVKSLEDSCMQNTGFEYRPFQKEKTMKQFFDEYHITLDDVRYPLGEHLVKGNSRSQTDSLRVAFAYDAVNKKVIVGFVGQHQTNRDT